ncbi:MAG: gamma-glutamyltransferase family protein [Bryobacteraceae bacterium]|nr:gamma-glutamyltransferase family protein [Bryobacteraceae bacterium]MDW8380119.1 gamma-glutamyltransferase family protein [Bryobacterales bacterium]
MMHPLWIVVILLFAVRLAAQPTMFPPVRGTREMVGAANNFEVEAGFRLLMQGGNAVDAGVAATLAAAVTEQARFGLGGEMPLIIHMANRKPVVISAVGTAPAKATVDYYRNRSPEPWETTRDMPPIPAQGLRAAILPGVFDGLVLALRKYGTKSFAEVVAPAIEYAEGFPIGEEFVSFLSRNQSLLNLWPTSTAFFLPEGRIPQRAEIYRLPALAKTLRELAAVERKTRGSREKKLLAVRDFFYKGDLARRLAEFSESHGGLISREDLARFQAEEEEPVCGTYRGYQICKPGFWTQGPVLIQALNILEGYDLKAMGHNSAQYLHTVVEAVKLAFADRDRYYGDPKFSKIPSEKLLSKDYAAERRRLVDPDQASMDHRPGNFEPPLPPPTASSSAPVAPDTTCVNVVDRWGNVFSATPSGAWLPSVIAGNTGIPFTTRLQSFVLTEGHANQLAPGKRPRVTLSPTLVLKDGRPYLAMSTPGGDNQDQAMLQALLNLLDFGMGPQEAVEAPRFQTEHFYSSFANHEFVPGKVSLEGRIPKAVVDALAKKGHRVQVSGDWSNGSAPTVIKIEKGVLDGGADPRRARFIFGR